MNDPLGQELGGEARSVLAALKGAESPSSAALDRGLARLEAELGLPATAGSPPSGATTAVQAGGSSLGSAGLFGILAVIGLGGAVALFVARPWSTESLAPESVVRVEGPALAREPSEFATPDAVVRHSKAPPGLGSQDLIDPDGSLGAERAPVEERTEGPVEAAEWEQPEQPKLGAHTPAKGRTAGGGPKRAGGRSPQPLPGPPEDDGADLSEELRLLGLADRALKKGAPGLALDHLLDHARRFPDSKLSHERTLTRVRALCAAGDGPGARREAKAYLAEHPSSHLADKIRKACPEP